MSGFRFRLYSDDWDELGEFVTVVPNWSTGDRVHDRRWSALPHPRDLEREQVAEHVARIASVELYSRGN